VAVVPHRPELAATPAGEKIGPDLGPEVIAESVTQRGNDIAILLAHASEGEQIQSERLVREKLGEADRGHLAQAVLHGKSGGQGLPVRAVVAHPFAVELQAERGILPQLPRVSGESPE